MLFQATHGTSALSGSHRTVLTSTYVWCRNALQTGTHLVRARRLLQRMLNGRIFRCSIGSTMVSQLLVRIKVAMTVWADLAMSVCVFSFCVAT